MMLTPDLRSVTAISRDGAFERGLWQFCHNAPVKLPKLFSALSALSAPSVL